MAGSETTATVLSATLYYLTTHPRVLSTLTEEVRSTFSSEKDITLLSVQTLRYTLAVLDETMRIHPAVPTGPPRLIAKGGDTVLNQYVPEDVRPTQVEPPPLKLFEHSIYECLDGCVCVAVASVPQSGLLYVTGFLHPRALDR